MTNLVKRIIVGVIGAGLLITLVIAHRLSFLGLVVVLSCLSLYEFYGLVKTDRTQPSRGLGLILGLLITLTPWLLTSFPVLHWYYFLFPFIVIIFFAELFRNKIAPFENIGLTFLGVLYISLPLGLFYLLGVIKGEYNWALTLGFFLMLWSNDTGAYFVGKALGKTKLFERISPGKTWEGALGGLLIAVICSQVLAYFFPALTMMQWAGMAIIITVCGTLGDLTESMLKRSIGKKDSGTILPGHGGFLDRFDGLFLSMPMVLFFLKLTM